jgi:Flp pilus assembly protein TadG
MKDNSVVKQFIRCIRRCESGSAMVETALTFPLFLAMLLGAVELGDIAYKSNELTNAARTAAQYATTNGGAYTDCNGAVPGATPVTCTAPGSGMYATAQNDAPLVSKACTNFTVQAATSCGCSDPAGTCAPATNGGYACDSGNPIILVSVYTSAQCSPAASVPGLLWTRSAFTLTGFAKQEVTR